ncbi:Ig-like domain-containing protein [Solimonas terrae]|uniref:BIG2 domain-containing protein n=1 Tax=Solimonas terrae TaxID=1396819 RepID=A0A6M2BSK5_9GAMM|nr:Ig-like domain-containing protein [Solimonas terrae]NGY05468.1 hypothetical protein [Solimonas terrae]
MKRYGLLSVLAALVLTACGNGSVKSPDFEPQLLNLAVTPASQSVGTGETRQFTAMGTFSVQPGAPADTPHDITDSVSWSSSDPSVASIDSKTGVATGVGQGTTTITASRDGINATATLTGEGIVLRSITVTPPQGATTVGGTPVQYVAQGVYSNSPTPQDITDAVISWTIADTTIGSIAPSTGKTVKVTGLRSGLTTVTASAKGIDGTAQFGVGQLTSVAISPKTASSPLGRAFQFQAIGTYSLQTGSSQTFTLPIPASWTAVNATGNTGDAPTLDTACDGQTSTSCKVTGHSQGDVDIKATVVDGAAGTFTDTAVLTVTEPVLDSVQITPDPIDVSPRTTPDNVDLPLGASQDFFPLYYYTDAPGVPVVAPRTAADKVVWSTSDATTVGITAKADNSITATAKKQGTANVVATAGSISDSVAVKVGPAAITQLLSVRPAKAYVGVGRQVEFTAVGLYSTGETKDIADGGVTWSSSDPSIASIDATTGVATAGANASATGVTITATLNSDTTQHATATLIVTPEACATPLLAADGATATEGPAVGVCLLCGVTGADNVIDADLASVGVITVGVGALNASRSIDVTAAASGAPYAVPFAAGSRPAFIIANANGPLVLAEVASQIQLSTLLNGAVQESTDNPVTPLRLDLLGAELISLNKTQGLVSFATSLPYDGVRIQLKSGLATALSTVEVGAACGTSLLPVQPASGISSLETAGVASTDEPSIEVGASLTLVAHDFTDPSQSLNSDDVSWTSGNTALATVSPTGVVTGVGAGEVVITGTLKNTSACGTHCSASRTIKVSSAICEVPLQMSQGATVDSLFSGLCLLCSTSNLNNVIDAQPQTYGQVYLPVGLLNAAVTVTATAKPPYAPFTAGPTTGFVVASENGALLTAEIGNQIVVRTLSGGTPTGDASNTAATPLRLDLLGTSLTGALGTTAQPLFISTTKSFDAVQITFNSGLATALSSYRLYAACGKGPQ